MNNIYIKVQKSNLDEFVKNECYEINLVKCIGSGSYGYIFLTDLNNMVAKIIVDYEKENYKIFDYLETDVLDKIIDSDVKINNRDYGYGELLNKEKYYLLSNKNYKNEKKKVKRISSILLYLNNDGVKSPIESRISNNGKTKSFYIFEGDKVILMPLFVSFYDYYYIFRYNFQNEKILCNIIKLLIEGIDELLLLGFINIDLKMNNIMIDRNNRIKIIDFGLVLSSEKINDKIDHNIKYYIWPRNNNFTFGMVLSYMIVIFILEIIYNNRIYSFYKKNSLITIIESEILLNKNYSEIFKKIIISVIKDGIEYDNFKNEMEILFDKHNIKKGKIPDYYNLLLWSKGLNIF